MFDISNELYTKTTLSEMRGFFYTVYSTIQGFE